MEKIKKEKEKIMNITLTLLAAALTFAGPTYLTYVLIKLGIPYAYADLIGLAAFIVGIIIFLRLAKKGKILASS